MSRGEQKVFFIEVLFENNKIKFKFNLDFYSIEKNTDNYFNEIEKVKNYTVNYNQDIDFETIINEFNKFKIVFAEKFFIDKKIDNNIQFIIYDDCFNENNRFIDFINNYKNINIVLHCHNYNAIIENLKDEDFPNLKDDEVKELQKLYPELVIDKKMLKPSKNFFFDWFKK